MQQLLQSKWRQSSKRKHCRRRMVIRISSRRCPPEELALLKKVRTYMKTKVAPIIIKYGAEDSFPFDLLTLLEFIGNLFLFPQSAGPFLTLFRKNHHSLERSKQQ